jgi:hypothetical protein
MYAQADTHQLLLVFALCREGRDRTADQVLVTHPLFR